MTRDQSERERERMRREIARAVLTFHGRIDDADSTEWALAFGTADAVLDAVWSQIDAYRASLDWWQSNYQTVQSLINELCICDNDPETTRGPEHDCPVPGHGEDEWRPAAVKQALSEAQAAIERVRDLHWQSPDRRCAECGCGWPCPTRFALDNPPAKRKEDPSYPGGAS